MSRKNLTSKSRELRGGRLMANCNCTRRNGLQYDCQRSECQGHCICLTRPFAKCCPSLFANRFEMVSMGKRSNPEGGRRIRVLNNGSMFKIFEKMHHFLFFKKKSYFFSGCVIQYDPRRGINPENPPNTCGPNNPLCDRFWK